MSYKGTDIENKSELPLPRECRQLRESINELRNSMKTPQNKGAIEAALDEVNAAWPKANRLQLSISQHRPPGDQVSMTHLSALADCLNDANQARGEAMFLLQKSW